MKHSKKAKYTMLTTGAVGAALIISVFFALSIEDVSTFQFLIGSLALLFATIFASFCCFRFIYVSKECKDA